MMAVPTGAGQVQEHETGASWICGGQSRSNDRAGLYETFVYGRHRCTMVPLVFLHMVLRVWRNR